MKKQENKNDTYNNKPNMIIIGQRGTGKSLVESLLLNAKKRNVDVKITDENNKIMNQKDILSKFSEVYEPSPKKEQIQKAMDKERVKDLICKAIDNIPDCAGIVDCYTEHSYYDTEAYIKVFIKVNEETDENIIEFHNIAHDAFGTDMGFIS